MNLAQQIVGRDPVCLSIENLLDELHTRGKEPLRQERIGGSVRLSFEAIQVEGMSYEIALVRLAMMMMNREQYRPLVIAKLSGEKLAAHMISFSDGLTAESLPIFFPTR